jgi:hypothetical protein
VDIVISSKRERMSEGTQAVHPTGVRPIAAGDRPISVVGWAMAVLVGVILWVIGFLLLH